MCALGTCEARAGRDFGEPSDQPRYSKVTFGFVAKVRGTNANTWEFARPQLERKEKDSGGLSAIAGVLVVLPTTAKA
jgi:hypothetical protein